MINSDIVPSLRQPRGAVLVNGVRIKGWIAFEVENNVFYEADTFHVKFSLSALPSDFNEAWWASQVEIFIELFAGFPADVINYSQFDLMSLVYGRVDDVEYNPIDRCLTVSGRDLTATMIDAKTTEKFQNLKASDIAISIAKRHGLTPVVTATKIKVGKFYTLDKNRLNDAKSEWDLITSLAQDEQFVVYVKGKTLHFEPQPAINADPYILRWQAPSASNGAYSLNAITMEFKRALTLSRGIIVTVQTINHKTGKTIKATYPANKASTIKAGGSAPVAQSYFRRIPQGDYQKALQVAQQMHKDLTQHEMKLSASLPADNILGVANILKVTGTGTAFDQIYYPESITRTLSAQEGYMMQISAKNKSPQNQVSL